MKKPAQKLSFFLKLDLNYFLTGGFWIIGNTLTSIFGGLFLSLVFARLWSSDLYGQYVFVTAIIGFLTNITLPGIGQILLQAASENKDGIYKQSIKSMAVWSIFGSIILLLLSIFYFTTHNFELTKVFLSLAILFPILNAGGLYNLFLNGKKQFKTMAILGILSQVTNFALILFALIYFKNLALVVILSSLATALSNILFTIYSFRFIKNKVLDRALTKFGYHLSLSQIMILGTDYFDRFIIPIYLGFSYNAIYAFALIIPNQIHALFKVFNNLGQPKIAQVSTRNLWSSLVKKSIQLEILILLIVISYIVLAPFIFLLFYPQYKDSATFFSQVFILSLLYYPTNLFILGLVKERKTKEIYLTNFLYFFLTITTLIWLIPIYGLWGAIVSKVITRLIYAICPIILSYRSFKKIN